MTIDEAKAEALEEFADVWLAMNGARVAGFEGSVAIEEALYARAAEYLGPNHPSLRIDRDTP